jgi:hypothetical protein
MDAIAAGKTINYVGAGGPVAFDQYQNSTGAFELIGYAANGTNPQLAIVSAEDIARLRK